MQALAVLIGNNIADGGAAETVIRATQSITQGSSGNPVARNGTTGVPATRISGHIAITPGVAATSVTIRIRRAADTSGAVVQGINAACTAGANIVIPFHVIDVAGATAGPGTPYCITVEELNATGPGTVISVYATVESLP